MLRFLTLVVCVLSAFAGAANAQKFAIEPLHFPAGTTLTFHLQTRLHPTGDSLDALPKGTALQIKILNSIDSDTDQDGAEFRGTIVSAVLAGNDIVVHQNAEVRGLLALLRSKSHPDGFRYELLVTSLTEQGGKPIALTASLKSSFSDDSSKSIPNPPAVSNVSKDPLSRIALPTHR